MIKRSTAIIACILVFVFTTAAVGIAGFFAVVVYTRNLQPQHTQVAAGDYALLDEIRSVVHQYALWDTDDEVMLKNAAAGMLYGEKDVYSEYFTAEEYNQYYEETAGNYTGVGMRVTVDKNDGYVTVLHVYKDSPAQAGGVQRGDKVLQVDGQKAPLNDLDTVRDMVRGEEGSQVTMVLLRNGEEVSCTLTRKAVVSDFCEWHMIDEQIGYLRILEFHGNVVETFIKGMKELQAQGMQGLVLDLRDNPGGDKDMVCRIADRLLPEGKIITMINKNGVVIDEDYSDAQCYKLPLVVLINENTASASELLSGNIQDYGMGLLVGQTTYGKGVGQSYARLSDGSVVCYTAFEYLTGGGRCPQEVGIAPDIAVEMPDDVYYDLLKWCTEADAQFSTALQELQKMMQK